MLVDEECGHWMIRKMMWIIVALSVSVTSVAVATIMQSHQWMHMGEGNVPTTSPISKRYARLVGDCARACSQIDTSVSFFFVEDTKECQCHDVKTHPLLMYEPSANYYEIGAAVPTVFSCPADNLSFRQVVLSDGSQFAYRALKDVSVSFDEAVTNCTAEGATLLEILTLEKFNFVMELMACPGFTPSFWLSGMFNITTARWETLRGDPLPLNDPFWISGEPNGNQGSPCVWMYNAFGHKWDDRLCEININAPTFALCEMP